MKKATVSTGSLSLIWLILCASLVSKHYELIYIFYSFVCSFVAAAVILPILQTAAAATITSTATNEDKLDNVKMAKKTTNINNDSYHEQTKRLVGLLACTGSFVLLFSSSTLATSNDDNKNGHSEYTALSIMAGYLGFDLWYSLLFCRRSSVALPIFAIWEHAITLTVFLVILARKEATTIKNDYFAYIIVWLVYKSAGLVLSLKNQTTKAAATTTLDQQQQQQDKDASNEDNLWKIHNEYYDLSDFVKLHPGGVESIELGRSRDCTALFESYHTFTNQHRVILNKYKMNKKVSLSSSSKVIANNDKNIDPFYEVLKQRVNKTLHANNIDPKTGRTATFGRGAYYVFLLICLVISAWYHMKAYLLGSISFAFFGWLTGCLGHDGGHFAVSRKPWINDFSVWGISLLCNPAMWQVQHTYAHHSHTNDFDHDPDLHHFEVFLRVHKRIQHERIHNMQRHPIFVFFAYCFVVFGTCLKIPIGMMKTGTLYGMVEWTDRKRFGRALIMWVHFALYIGIIIVSPFFSGRSLFVALLAVILHIGTAGLLFAIFSQINHLNEMSLELKKDENDSSSCDDDKWTENQKKRDIAKNSWAARQVETSNNFATNSMVWHLLSNGLNMQIEHHLFPSLNHAHLHVIAPVVQQTCEEYGVHYKSYESWSEIIGAALQWLDKIVEDEKLT